jgi:hypothetical protein
MHFKKWQKHWEWCINMVEDYFKGDGGSTIPEIMDTSWFASVLCSKVTMFCCSARFMTKMKIL